jgi:hypothetical protein
MGGTPISDNLFSYNLRMKYANPIWIMPCAVAAGVGIERFLKSPAFFQLNQSIFFFACLCKFVF